MAGLPVLVDQPGTARFTLRTRELSRGTWLRMSPHPTLEFIRIDIGEKFVQRLHANHPDLLVSPVDGEGVQH